VGIIISRSALNMPSPVSTSQNENCKLPATLMDDQFLYGIAASLAAAAAAALQQQVIFNVFHGGCKAFVHSGFVLDFLRHSSRMYTYVGQAGRLLNVAK